jgi:hypothetical protein
MYMLSDIGSPSDADVKLAGRGINKFLRWDEIFSSPFGLLISGYMFNLNESVPGKTAHTTAGRKGKRHSSFERSGWE